MRSRWMDRLLFGLTRKPDVVVDGSAAAHKSLIIKNSAMGEFQIITFYEFKRFEPDALPSLRDALRAAMREHSIKGTIILAEEGVNSTIAGRPTDIAAFVAVAERILNTQLECKSSYHKAAPFRRIDVKIKTEIVALKRRVDISNGDGTHVSTEKWNDIISDPETFVLDTRNDYEFHTGTFQRAVNPQTKKFSELPEYVAANLDPDRYKRIAMFCTGGIRCEKFAPYLKQLGFAEVYQLKGGILKYLEEVPADQSLWQGECFVFDDRVSVDGELRKGKIADLSQKPE